MKCDTGVTQPKPITESRKIRKPLMEKKRRARINDSLETLKQILLENRSSKQRTIHNNSVRSTAKLEKADILEMTVRYIQNLRETMDQRLSTAKQTIAAEAVTVRPADSSCESTLASPPSPTSSIGITLVPTQLTNGEIVFIVPNMTSSPTTHVKGQKPGVRDLTQNVWRPW